MSFITEQGRKALIRVAEWLEDGAPHATLTGHLITFDMGEPVTPRGCGTACCIAGTISQFEKFDLKEITDHMGAAKWFDYDDVAGLMTRTRIYLGISEEHAEELFVPWDYFGVHPDDYNNPYYAAKVIRNFLDTGNVDWDNVDNENE